MPNVQRCIAATIDKIETLSNEEKLTNFVRKKIHSAINDRTQQVINRLVEQLQQYAETLHQQVVAVVKPLTSYNAAQQSAYDFIEN